MELSRSYHPLSILDPIAISVLNQRHRDVHWRLILEFDLRFERFYGFDGFCQSIIIRA